MKASLLSRYAPYLFLFPSLLLLVAFVYAPALENMVYSLFSWSSVRTEQRFVGLDNYRELFANPVFWRALVNNVLYAVISIMFQVIVALVIAAVLVGGIIGPRQRTLFRTAFFLPSILPVTVVGLLWQLIYQPTIGLIDQVLYSTGLQGLSHVWLGEEATVMISVIMVSQWQWTGYMIVLFMVSIQAIPDDLYEALKMEGANRIQQFFHITVPGVRESTLILAIITIFGAFKVFDIVWVMTAGGPNNASEVLGTHMYRSAFRNDVSGYAAAVATVIFLITLAIGAVQIRLQRQD
ncbi:MAG: sugar ABC transporter permease [Rhodobacteraceae bacterium]|nr:sugar ABC transporter permease [Paracoccaceae bacterium]